MATRAPVNMLNNVMPDTSGLVTPSFLDNQLTMTNPHRTKCWRFQAPSGADIELEGSFRVPADYVGTPVGIIRYVIDGTPASIVAWGLQVLAVAHSESVDAAFGTADLANNSTWTGIADKEEVEETISISVTLAAGDTVYWKLFADDSVDTSSVERHLVGLHFQYNDA